MNQQVAILAAGRGTRLGRPHPKPLTPLRDGSTILGSQLAKIRATFDTPQIYVVVGFKLEMILEAHPDAVFVYNEAYDETNTSQSLLRALRATNVGGVLWLNGDVVFDPALLELTRALIEAEQSFVAVNTESVADEEVKYTLDDDGWIRELSKSVTGGLGEAVGVNYVAAADKAALLRRLSEVDDQDYFERGIELAIEHDGLRFAALDISALAAVEVDTPDDLVRANASLDPRQT
ncbi:MAG TPA: NTP transferase domain-containing protein [Jatrophihabitans sp.]|jgi:choline kinase|uniref:phosphocholine cytidylyltransferase family protein n=1 Tax=Jatrophihabitans sp. TaxID=1932789 RepID=UPI002E0A8C62|nr:NTP transferase domain-containing protein [Jatrophihabitans sp.]